MRKVWTRLWLAILAASSVQVTAAAAPGRHVVVVVWDGMRPDFVSEQNTPVLWQLAKSGVVFGNHHPVYPSATIVNGTAINTGHYPNHDGILANRVYRPDIDDRKSIDVENAEAVKRGDDVSGGRYVSAPTIAELLHARGDQTGIATAKTVGLLFDRHEDSKLGHDFFAGRSVRPGDISSVVKSLGVYPPATNAAGRDQWTTKALTDFLWKDGIPAFSLLWLSEPDDTEHKTAPGAPAALAAIKSSDKNLALMLAGLEKHQAKANTDVFVVSDHGFSTIARQIQLPKILRAAGFDVVTQFTDQPKPGQIMLVGNGGTVLFYVIGHDTSTTRQLVAFLQQTDFAGVIFTREQMEGTCELQKAEVDNEYAPDVEMAFRWNENKNPFGTPGMIDGDWQRAAGEGTHATLSRFDMHNTLIAAGPDFANGLTSELPSGNVDLAPTILSVLGITPPALDGRILAEALKKPAKLAADVRTMEASKKFSTGTWRQHLRISQVGSTTYLDEGNGGFEPQR